ncbi:hypothetical protein RMN56_20645 [Micromonospora halotolerans]|uniref:MAE-28990/MAE-18760-like HEPN domain-containing protein n=1 Tax=Micromonospora halotolerans TaxID=709879 RepID=A0ABY9ZT75_9ACTN|nr:hypothetical protein [Micromonospora halotolerans]WNM37566.1 hypothetical protein RMN56_20645 [Micromonospora halotolerans]
MMLDITEGALEELTTTYARHNATTTGRPPARSLRRYRDGIVGDAAAADRAACWLRLVSVVEIYTETLLRRLSDEQPGRAPRGWSDVTESLKRHHNIDVAAVEGWARLDASFTVRNAVAHGLGRFTARQIEKGEPRKMRLIAVQVRDGAVVITPEALAACAETCRVFVTALDACSRPSTAFGPAQTEACRRLSG